MELLKKYGWKIIEPAVGYLACGDTGAGKFPEEGLILEHILNEIALEKDMEGLHVLVTAGPTMEAIDPVRFISNHSTGKMGYAIARVCRRRGAEVTLVTGRTNLKRPVGMKVVEVCSAQEMFDAVTAVSSKQDIMIKAAAVADYRPAVVADQKVKKQDGELVIELERTQDILAWLGQHKGEQQILCGFAMETQQMVEHAREKLERKHLDLIAANNVKVAGAGFGTDTNVVTLITEKETRELELMSKEEVAVQIIDELLHLRNLKGETRSEQ
jgi:phosphopantothenoylcysteine decarboxylase/phosphopantothenate--cysteine ligase